MTDMNESGCDMNNDSVECASQIETVEELKKSKRNPKKKEIGKWGLCQRGAVNNNGEEMDGKEVEDEGDNEGSAALGDGDGE